MILAYTMLRREKGIDYAMSIQDMDHIQQPKRKNKKKPLNGRDTRLVIDGNSVYELDQNCLKKGGGIDKKKDDPKE